MLVAVEGLYLYQEFVTDGYASETYYYTSYEFAFIVLGTTLVAAELAKRPWFGEQAPVASRICIAAAPRPKPGLRRHPPRGGRPYRSWWG